MKLNDLDETQLNDEGQNESSNKEKVEEEKKPEIPIVWRRIALTEKQVCYSTGSCSYLRIVLIYYRFFKIDINSISISIL